MNRGGESSAMISWSAMNSPTTCRSGFRSVQDVGPAIINRLMLRFRPIAPKPSPSSPATEIPSATTNSCTPRKRRKYDRARKSNNNNGSHPKRKDTSSSSSSTSSSSPTHPPKPSNDVVTLQLLPENNLPRAARDQAPAKKQRRAALDDESCPPSRCNLDLAVSASADLVSCRREKVVEESRVTVESRAEISSSDLAYCTGLEEVKMRLSVDTCPGLVTDGCNRVVWVNGAYRRMVGMMTAAAVRVVMKDDEVAACFGREIGGGAYTCWVRVRGETWRKEMVPCDVWRLENGGLAWRLDVESALTLGPG
ncbi:unnamed protein product [Linum trigynum]|uniref:DUF7950 domain-containing protein n=1 Tax=Linum trigynum TaxID=586398 RepID=A0AAV2CQI4_9ROSI